jgi:xanthine dehydrogenase YagR molybdenum-binding subunit
VTGRPWSSKKLREAYAEGAALFGWARRHDGPRRDGPWRIGTGMATCSMGTFRFAGGARVRLRSDGSALVESDVQDIGTGIQTVLRAIVADELDLPLERIFLRWGDSSLPVTGPLYGSGGTMHTGSAVTLACRQILEKLATRSDHTPALEALRDTGLPEISAEGSSMPPGDRAQFIDLTMSAS